jgi:two-component system cell cycle sensor histidine kinase/response regulator CckA
MPSSEKLETILVVDDTPAILTVVVAVLKTANFNVLTGRSGAEAISVAMRYEGTIHLLLSDIQMPGMNGPELGKLLKAQRPDLRADERND